MDNSLIAIIFYWMNADFVAYHDFKPLLLYHADLTLVTGIGTALMHKDESSLTNLKGK
jgi:hypothetical protein